MNKQMVAKLKAAGREDLIEIAEIVESGYAGVLPNGNIVDRRKHPKAIPLQRNALLGVPKPRSDVK